MKNKNQHNDIPRVNLMPTKKIKWCERVHQCDRKHNEAIAHIQLVSMFMHFSTKFTLLG